MNEAVSETQRSSQNLKGPQSRMELINWNDYKVERASLSAKCREGLDQDKNRISGVVGWVADQRTII